MTKYVIGIFACISCSSVCSAVISKEEALRICEQYYTKFAGKLTPTNVPFAGLYKEPFRAPVSEISIESDFYAEDSIWINGQVSIGCVAGTHQLTAFSNKHLFRYIQTNETQKIPSFSAKEAYDQAKKYLDVLGFETTNRMVLTDLSFGDNSCSPWGCTSVWRVVWMPLDGGYRHDDFLVFYNPQLRLCFSEKYGFIFCVYTPFPPAPKTTEVRISRESAIFKAEKAVPLVMLTPYYQQCRLPGFKASGVKSAELRIACPNWLLDPARAIWIWDSPPKETRLCWIVRFTTVDTVKREEGMKPSPPDILIYIDAATGEIVGANFT